jgi:predicted dehydrogenase
MASAPSIAVVGIHGHGATHVAHARELERHGAAHLAAIADPIPPGNETGLVGAMTPHFTSLRACLAEGGIDVVIIATPISTHCEQARAALAAGCDVLLEKPPAASVAEFVEIGRAADRMGGLIQVGFQSLGSHAVRELSAMVRAGAIGRLESVAIEGMWLRTTSYWQRSRWARRRTIGGVSVVDGVATNPLAHSFAAALALLGCSGPGGITGVELDQYHVNEIEADDTSSVRLSTPAGPSITAALTLCAPSEKPPVIVVQGSEGSIELVYIEDTAVMRDRTGLVVRDLSFERDDLLKNLLDVRSRRLRGEPGADEGLLVPLRSTSAFMELLEAVRNAPAPRPIDSSFVTWVDDNRGRHPVLHDAEA